MQSHGSIPIFDDTRFLALEWYLSSGQFETEGVSICRFEKAGAQFSVHRECAIHGLRNVALSFVVER